MKNFYTVSISKLFSCFFLTVMLIAKPAGKVFAQSTNNYTYSVSFAGSLLLDRNGNNIDMTTGTTTLLGPSKDDEASVVKNIGFDFFLLNAYYNQFSVNSNGLVRLGATPISGTTYKYGQSSQTLIAAMGGDLEISNTGKIHYKVVGSSPNRCIVIEFLNMGLPYYGGYAKPDGTYQVRLYENAVIEFVYGKMFKNSATPTQGFNTGFSYNTGSGNIASIKTSDHSLLTNGTVTLNYYPLSTNIAGLHSDSDSVRTTYTFVPNFQDNSGPNISYPILATGDSAANRILTSFASITDLSGVDTAAGTKPRIYYKRSTDANTFVDNSSATNGWKYAEATNTTSPFDFTIDYTILNGGNGITPGNIIQYFVVAQDKDTTPNVGINLGTFASQPTSVNLSAAAFPITGSIRTYGIAQSFTGTLNVGVGESYTSLTGNNGLFKALNENILTNDLVVRITSDLVEDGTNPLNQLAESGAGNYSIKIKSDGQPRLISAANNAIPGTSMIKINGADRITFDGDSAKLLTFRNNTLNGARGVFDFTNTSKGDTIKNCIIESSFPSTTNGVINIADVGENEVAIISNELKNPTGASDTYAVGVQSSSDSNRIVISDNNFANFSEYGIYIQLAKDSTVITGNSFYYNLPNSPLYAQHAIHLEDGAKHQVIGNFIGGTLPKAGGAPWVNSSMNSFYAIYLSSSDTSAPSSIQGNVIQNLRLTNPSVQTFYGIDLVSATVNVGTEIGNIIGSLTDTNSIIISGTGTVNAMNLLHGHTTVENNIIANIHQTSADAEDFFGIYTFGSARFDLNKNKIYNCGPGSNSTSANKVTGIYLYGGNGSTIPVTVNNNMISLGLNVSNTNQYIGIENSGFTNNNMFINNNTVLLRGTATGAAKSYGYLKRTGTNSRAYNNIFVNLRNGTAANYAIGFTNLSGTIESNYNLLKTADPNIVAEFGTGNSLSFANYKVSSGKDSSSVSGAVPFISNLDLHIDSTHFDSWNVNGRGIAISTVPDDIDGDARSTTVGLPTDIGADEFNPGATSTPTVTNTSSSPAPGSTTSAFSADRKIADITWGTQGTVPSQLKVQYFTGTKPAGYTGGLPTINSYYNIEAVAGSSYTYSIKYYYTNAEKNNIADANLRIIKQDGNNPWTIIGGTAGSDANGKFILATNLTSFSRFSLADASGLLPVTKSALTGKKENRKNHLSWSSYTEINNAGYEVQRSTDGVNFESISFVRSKALNGTSNGTLKYEFTEELITKTNSYYKLKQVDKDGKFSYSNIVLLKNAATTSFEIVSLSPNPTSNTINLLLNTLRAVNAELIITDISGRHLHRKVVQLFEGDNNLSLPVTLHNKGTYIIRLTTNDGENKTVKFVKE